MNTYDIFKVDDANCPIKYITLTEDEFFEIMQYYINTRLLEWGEDLEQNIIYNKLKELL